MKPEILHNDHMMFLDRALETQRTALAGNPAHRAADGDGGRRFRVPHGGGPGR